MRFVQRTGEVADITFEGVEARILRDGEVFIDWTAGGVLEDVPQGDGYTLEVRAADGSITAEDLAIGAVVIFMGQSNGRGWFSNFTSYPAASSTYQWTEDGWGDVAGLGARYFSEMLSQALGAPVAMINATIGGSALLPEYDAGRGYWLSTESGSPYDLAISQLMAATGASEIALWSQGETDRGASTEVYAAGLQEFFERVLTEMNVPVFIQEIGHTRTTLGEQLFGYIRDAQHLVADAMDRVEVGALTGDIIPIDGGHYSGGSYVLVAMRMLESILTSMGLPFEATPVMGSSDGEVLDGTSGTDFVYGFAGNDTLNGVGGSDILTGGVGDDVINGGEGNDDLYGEDGNDLLDGGAGNDALYGYWGNDSLTGGDGDDMLDGGDGVDLMSGGFGSDTYYIEDLAERAVELSGEGSADLIWTDVSYTLADTDEVEFLYSISGYADLVLTGNSQANAIRGRGTNDTIYGGGGNDTLDGRVGVDIVYGGAGNDRIYVDNADDQVFDYAGEGSSDYIYANISYELAAGAEIEFFYANSGIGLELTGNELNNHIHGGDGNDVLRGGAGDDRMEGRSGVDLLYGGEGNDRFYVDEAADEVFESVGGGIYDYVYASTDYTLAAGVEVEYLYANAGAPPLSLTGNELANRIYGSGGNDTLAGGGGDDRLDGRAGADAMHGGDGNDRYYVDAAADQVFEAMGGGAADYVYATVAYALTAGAEVEYFYAYAGNTPLTLTGNEFDNRIYGAGGDDTLYGVDGNDIIDGRAGADLMYGGAGNDRFYIDNASDQVFEYANEGSEDYIYASADYQMAASVAVEYLYANAGSTGLTLVGNELDNHIHGGSGNDTLYGGAGNDTLEARGGADFMSGGTGNDRYYVDNAGEHVCEFVGEGTADYVYASVNYALFAGEEVEYLNANAGNTGLILSGNEFDNSVNGGAGNDTLYGGAGNDRLSGRAGVDAMYGGSGNDRYYVDDAGDSVLEYAGEGTDDYVYSTIDYTLAAGADIERLYANAGIIGLSLTGNELANRITGSNGGDDILFGEAGEDRLYGNAGNDLLIGGEGLDRLYGGAGADVFVLANNEADRDIIADFALDDQLQLSIGGGVDGLFAGVALTGMQFVSNSSGLAADGGDGTTRFVYNATTGLLYFDSDGSGAASNMLIATMTGSPALTAADFDIVT